MSQDTFGNDWPPFGTPEYAAHMRRYVKGPPTPPITRLPTKWRVPSWMLPYIETITNTGREPTKDAIEALYNGSANAQINLPLVLTQAAVFAQISMLYNLQRKGHLK